MRIILSVIFALCALTAHAEIVMPQDCKPVTIEGETVQLSTLTPQVFLVHNMSNMDLWVTRPVAEAGAAAGWSSRLQAGNWSAFALNEKAFELSCIESKPGHEQQVPCSGVLLVCEWAGVKQPADLKNGTYWAGEDMSLTALKTYIARRGFVMPKAGADSETN